MFPGFKGLDNEVKINALHRVPQEKKFKFYRQITISLLFQLIVSLRVVAKLWNKCLALFFFYSFSLLRTLFNIFTHILKEEKLKLQAQKGT